MHCILMLQSLFLFKRKGSVFMPIYEFVCEKCNHSFEYLILSLKDRPDHCPQCRGKKLKKLISAGNVRPKGIPSGSGGFAPPKCAPAGA